MSSKPFPGKCMRRLPFVTMLKTSDHGLLTEMGGKRLLGATEQVGGAHSNILVRMIICLAGRQQ